MLHIVDYALLKPYLTLAQIAEGARRAEALGVASYCVQPIYAQYVKPLLSRVKLCAVIDFPHGALPTVVRSSLITRLVDYVDEFDIVTPLGFLKSHMWREVRRDLITVVSSAGGRVVKVIIEEPYLTEDERRMAIDIAAEAGAHFVKNSTGFVDVDYAKLLGNPPHSTPERAVEIVNHIKERGYKLGVKIAGGIRTKQHAQAIIEAVGLGLDPARIRIGTSTPESLVEQKRSHDATGVG